MRGVLLQVRAVAVRRGVCLVLHTDLGAGGDLRTLLRLVRDRPVSSTLPGRSGQLLRPWDDNGGAADKCSPVPGCLEFERHRPCDIVSVHRTETVPNLCTSGSIGCVGGRRGSGTSARAAMQDRERRA